MKKSQKQVELERVAGELYAHRKCSTCLDASVREINGVIRDRAAESCATGARILRAWRAL